VVQIRHFIEVISEPVADTNAGIALEYVIRALQLKARESKLTCPLLRRWALLYIRMRLAKMNEYFLGRWPSP
jgi:hypothetical protein